MRLSRRVLISAASVVAATPLIRPRAQGTPTIKIGVLNDMSGTYQNVTGPTSVVCCKQALEDFGVSGKGLNVEVINADHQNKPDLAVSISRQWFDRDGVDMILDVTTSSVALAVQSVVKEKNKVFLGSSPATAALTGEQCSPNFIHWTYDTYMLSKSTGAAMVKAGGDFMVFYHCRLCIRKTATGRHNRACASVGWQGTGSISVSFPWHHGFLRILGAGTGQRCQGARPRQCRC